MSEPAAALRAAPPHKPLSTDKRAAAARPINESKTLRKLEWRVRHAVENVLSGEYRSAFRGRGMEFDQVVRYEFGDDVRDIDWNVTARLGEPYRKKFVEERELTLLLLFEDSPSLNFGSGTKTKREALLELAGLLMLLGAVNRDRVGFLHCASASADASAGPRCTFRAPVRGRHAILHHAAQLLAMPPPAMISSAAGADVRAALEQATRQLGRSRAVPKHSILVWLGDFAPRAQPEGWAVLQRRYQTMGFRVDDPWERALPAELGGSSAGLFGGAAPLATYDPLSSRLVTLENSAAARAAHAAWRRQRDEQWQALFPVAHNRLCVCTEDDQLDALVRFFHTRMHLAR